VTVASLGPARRFSSIVVASLLLTAGLTGCRSADHESGTPTKGMKALCSAYTTLPDSGSARSSISAWNAQFATVAPPEGMPELARVGMRLQSEASTRTTPVPGNRDEVAALESFHAYSTQHCGDMPISLTAE
jgi:hypothetical protein